MGIFDQDGGASIFNDPTKLYPWMGMAQAFGQMGMPSRFKMPLGSVLAAGAGGFMQGQQAAQDYGLKKQEMGIKQQQQNTAQLNNAMQLANVNLYRSMAGLPPIQMPGSMNIPMGMPEQGGATPNMAPATGGQPPAGQPAPAGGGNLDYNIGNVRTGGGTWQGVGAPQKGFEAPDSPESGVRMNAINLRTHLQQLGQENATIANLSMKWTDPKVDDPVSWMNNVSKASGIPADVPINLSDPQEYAKLLRGINIAEKGKQTVPDSAYAAGVQLAQNGGQPPAPQGQSLPQPPQGQPQPQPQPQGMANSPLSFLQPMLARLGVSPQQWALLQMVNPKAAEALLTKAIPNATQDLRQGGSIWGYDPQTGQYKVMAQAPVLGEGQRLDAGGSAQIVPGFLPNMAAIDATKQSVKANMTPQEITLPNGSKAYTTQAQVLAQAQGANQPPGQPGQPQPQLPIAAQSPSMTAEQSERGKDLGQLPQKLAEDAGSAKNMNFLLDQMNDSAKDFRLGWGQSIEGKLRGTLAGIGQALGMDTTDMQKTQGSYEAFNKDAMQTVMQAVKQVSSRAAVQEFKMIQQSLPNSDMTPQGFSLVTNQFYATNDFKIAKQQAAQQWSDSHGGSLSGFEPSWNLNITPGAFYFLRLAPDQQQSLVGKMQSSAEGMSFLKRLRGEIAWGHQQGVFGAQ